MCVNENLNFIREMDVLHYRNLQQHTWQRFEATRIHLFKETGIENSSEYTVWISI